MTKARRYGIIEYDFWLDPRFDGLSVPARLLYLFLWTKAAAEAKPVLTLDRYLKAILREMFSATDDEIASMVAEMEDAGLVRTEHNTKLQQKIGLVGVVEKHPNRKGWPAVVPPLAAPCAQENTGVYTSGRFRGRTEDGPRTDREGPKQEQEHKLQPLRGCIYPQPEGDIENLRARAREADGPLEGEDEKTVEREEDETEDLEALLDSVSETLAYEMLPERGKRREARIANKDRSEELTDEEILIEYTKAKWKGRDALRDFFVYWFPMLWPQVAERLADVAANGADGIDGLRIPAAILCAKRRRTRKGARYCRKAVTLAMAAGVTEKKWPPPDPMISLAKEIMLKNNLL